MEAFHSGLLFCRTEFPHTPPQPLLMSLWPQRALGNLQNDATRWSQLLTTWESVSRSQEPHPPTPSGNKASSHPRSPLPAYRGKYMKHPFICASSIHSKSVYERRLHQESVRGAQRAANEADLTPASWSPLLISIESPVYQATLHAYVIYSLQQALEEVTFVPFYP